MRVPWQAKFGALALIWGSSFLLMKVGLEALAPLQLGTLRIVTGAVTVLITALVLGARLPRGAQVWGHLTVSGFLLCSLPFTLFPLGEERVSSALAGIGNATTPLSTVLFTLLLIPTERVNGRTLTAVMTGFAGVVVIAQPWQAQGRPDLVGFGMTLVAGASYGLGWTYVRRFLARHDVGGLSLPAGQLLMASAQMVVIIVVWWLLHWGPAPTGIPLPWSVRAESPSSVLWPLLAVLALGAVGTGLAYALQFDVVRAVGPTVSATVTYVIPVVAVLLGVVFLAERLQWPQVLGAAVILVSAVVVGRPRRARTEESAEPTSLTGGAAAQPASADPDFHLS
jgi:drug/metabolite transporter (DMT)-like permease